MLEAILAACDPAALLFGLWLKDDTRSLDCPRSSASKGILKAIRSRGSLTTADTRPFGMLIDTNLVFAFTENEIRSGPRIQAYHCLLQLLRIQLFGLDDTMDAVIRLLTASFVQWVC